MTRKISRFFYTFLFLIAFASISPANETAGSRRVATEGAIFTLNKNGTVTIKESFCEECDTVTLRINPETRLFDSNGREQSMDLLGETFIRSAGFLYLVPENAVLKIHLHSIEEAVQ